MHEIECIISGRVQMVMFRDFAQKCARTLNLTGHVKNCPDGTVCVIAQGEKENLEKLLERLHRGPAFAKVEKVETVWQEPKRSFAGFHILR